MKSIRELNKYCIDRNKSIVIHKGLLVGFSNEKKIYEV